MTAPMTRVLVTGLTFAEGSRWHDGRLWFSDFYTQRVLAMDPEGRTETIADGRRSAHRAWASCPTARRSWSRCSTGACSRSGPAARRELVADLREVTGGPCNDMVVDGKGRAYVGNFGYEKWNGAPQRLTRIVRVDPDGSVHPTGTELLFPNGMVITPDGRTLVVGETFSERMSAYDIDEAGDLAQPSRVCAHRRRAIPTVSRSTPRARCGWPIPRASAAAACSRAGASSARSRFATTGAPYTCALGGEDRRTLYIVTCTNSGPQMADKRDGCIESIEVDVPGAGWP